ncbi:MAG: HEPN domain-containing protein [FCB group bacterium]|jgi:HEPN domain-containing protein
MNDKTINNWLKIAEYDLTSAEAMLNSKRYIYVAFMCQQAIEKLLKAIYVKQKNETPPYIHNLNKLFSSIKLDDKISDVKKLFIVELNNYYVESRYAEDIAEISKKINKKKATEILKVTQELFEWLKCNI